MSHDTLLFYFDNEKRSGVSGVIDVQMHEGFCLVYFEEPEGKNQNGIFSFLLYIKMNVLRWQGLYMNRLYENPLF